MKKKYLSPDVRTVSLDLSLAMLIPSSLLGGPDNAGADFWLDDDDTYEL